MSPDDASLDDDMPEIKFLLLRLGITSNDLVFMPQSSANQRSIAAPPFICTALSPGPRLHLPDQATMSTDSAR